MNALAYFFCRKWFERAWVIQEVVVAASNLVVCGSLALCLDKLYVLSIFMFESGWAYELQSLYAMIEDRILVKPLYLNRMAL